MIASVGSDGVVSCIGDATGGGSLLPPKGPPAVPPKHLGRTVVAPVTRVSPLGRPLAAPIASQLAKINAPAKIDFRGGGEAPSVISQPSPTGGTYANGANYAGPDAPVDAGASDYYPSTYDPSQSPTAAGGAASSTPVAANDPNASQQMTLAQAQASGGTPVGYYVAGGAAVLALGLGLFLFTR